MTESDLNTAPPLTPSPPLNPWLHGLLTWSPALIAMGVIACESTELFASENTSRWLYPIWEFLFGPVSIQRWDRIHFLIRKTGHFTGYGLVSLSFFFSWSRSLGHERHDIRKRLNYAALSLLSTFLIACADEYHQRFLRGRTSSFRDVMIDTIGASVALTTALLIRAWMARRRLRPA